MELLAKIVDMGAENVVSNSFQIAVSGGEWTLAQHTRMPGNVSVSVYKNHRARSSSLKLLSNTNYPCSAVLACNL